MSPIVSSKAELLDLRADVERLRTSADLSGLLPLAKGEARVWWLALPTWEGLSDEGLSRLQALEDLLSETELERLGRFRFEKDRLTYIAAHALGRILLSKSTGEHASFWQFDIGERGKPEVRCPAPLPNLRLNISHTEGCVAAALTCDRDIGVDVERISRQPDVELVSRRVFSDEETKVILSSPKAQQVDTFLRFWTLKEAYVKAIGKGLAQPLKRISFQLEGETGHPLVRFDGLAEPDASWHFRQAFPTDDHVLALALNASSSEAVMDFKEVSLGLA